MIFSSLSTRYKPLACLGLLVLLVQAPMYAQRMASPAAPTAPISAIAQPDSGTIAPYTAGDAVDDFRLQGEDGRYYALSDYATAPAAVVVFTCNSCPCVEGYDTRMVWLTRFLAAEGIPVLAINANRADRRWGESLDDMRTRADSAGYNFPYLIDETQAVARRFGATRTPEAFVLGRDPHGVFRLLYSGAIDDRPGDPTGVTRHYVNEAIAMYREGAVPDRLRVEPMGCTIEGISRSASVCPMETMEDNVRKQLELR